jgi:hypothetical protein
MGGQYSTPIDRRGILGPAHPQRERIDRILGRLVGVGVAEAHQLEKQIEQATMTVTQGTLIKGACRTPPKPPDVVSMVYPGLTTLDVTSPRQ